MVYIESQMNKLRDFIRLDHNIRWSLPEKSVFLYTLGYSKEN